MKYNRFPKGHPIIITHNFDDIYANFDSYFGLVQCEVLPPRYLKLPVLPGRYNGKLIFGLCNTCCLEQQKTECLHTNEERAIYGEELKLAILFAL